MIVFATENDGPNADGNPQASIWVYDRQGNQLHITNSGDNGQGPRIVDVKVAGVSLFMTRRSEFNTVIQKSGGAIEPLVAQLEARAR